MGGWGGIGGRREGGDLIASTWLAYLMGSKQVGPFVAKPDGLQPQCLGAELIDDVNQACILQ